MNANIKTSADYYNEGIIADEITANELIQDVFCHDCGRLLSGSATATLFQTDKGEDVLPGYYCEKCAIDSLERHLN